LGLICDGEGPVSFATEPGSVLEPGRQALAEMLTG
jgi:hypothetical protein